MSTDSDTISSDQLTSYYNIPWFIKCLPCCMESSNDHLSITGSLIGTSDIYDDPTHPNLVTSGSEEEENEPDAPKMGDGIGNKKKIKREEKASKVKTNDDAKAQEVTLPVENDPFEGLYVDLSEVDKLLRLSNVSESQSPYSSFLVTQKKSSKTGRKQGDSKYSRSKNVSSSNPSHTVKRNLKAQQRNREKSDSSHIREKLEKELSEIHKSRESADCERESKPTINLNEVIENQIQILFGDSSDDFEYNSENKLKKVISKENDSALSKSTKIETTNDVSVEEDREVGCKEPVLQKNWMVW